MEVFIKIKNTELEHIFGVDYVSIKDLTNKILDLQTEIEVLKEKDE
mgnify:CR=1 FL=1